MNFILCNLIDFTEATDVFIVLPSSLMTLGAGLPASFSLSFEEILPVSSSDSPSEIIVTSKRTQGFALLRLGSVSDETVCVVSSRIFNCVAFGARQACGTLRVYGFFSEKRTRDSEKVTEEGSYLPTSH